MTTSEDFHIKLDNFQSITKGDLIFSSGVNVVVGQSNSGKSAILRAIKANVQNPKGAQRYVQYGKDKATVTIEYLGNTVTWERTEKDAKYYINGELYKKIGNTDIFQYLQNTGFVKDDKNILMNIEGELQLPFPFDKNPQELFKLFENLLSVLQSSGVLKQFKHAEDVRNNEISLLESEVSRLQNKVQAIDELQKEVDINKLKDFKTSLKNSAEKKENISADLTEISYNMRVLKATKIEEHTRGKNLLSEYTDLLNDINKVESSVQLCKNFKPPKPINMNLIDKYEELKGLIQASELINTLDIKERKERAKVDFETYKSLRSDIKELQSIKVKASQASENLAKVRNTIQAVKEELKEYKICPLCGHKLGE